MKKSQLVFGTKKTLAEKRFSIAADAGLLFPSHDSVELGMLETRDQPSQLIVIDGTWSQAKSLVRALPQLQALPCYKLAPTQPGQYRIRLEPTDTSLSTVEATVAALKALEPDTENLDQLLDAFELMVQKQLDHPEVGEQHYSGGPIDGSTFNVPNDLFVDPTRIIVAYGEANFRRPTDPKKSQRSPVFWCAQNLGTGEMFHTALLSDACDASSISETFLDHLELSRSEFDQALDMSEFVAKWDQFSHGAEVIVSYSDSTPRLLRKAIELSGVTIGSAGPNWITLKSINFKASERSEASDSPSFSPSFDSSVVGQRSKPSAIPGRAGIRLANIVSTVIELLKENR